MAAALSLCACDDDKNPTWPVPQPVVDTLFDMYPTAQNIDWYRSGSYSVARFVTMQDGAAQYRWAWFDASGTWYMTETDVTLLQMPQAVQSSFGQSSYSGWEFEDGDKLERAGLADVYVVEVESGTTGKGRNETRTALYYTADGTLIKTVFNPREDYHYSDMLPSPLPAAVSTFIQTEYPSAQLINSYFGENLSRVEVLDAGVLRTLWFNGSNEWLYTVTVVNQQELPEVVLSAFAGSAYSGYTVEEVYYYQTPTANYYRMALTSNGKTIEIDITPEGGITQVGN